jgi:hypothetical protein
MDPLVAYMSAYVTMPDWLRGFAQSPWGVGLGLALLVLGVASLIALPVLLVRIPSDHFVAPRKTVPVGSLHWLGRIAKNVLGAVLLLLGIAMLVLPGQGVLTIIGALVLLDFPGKRRLERWLVLRPKVLQSLNRMRTRAGRPPFEQP